jgi:SLOG in TRPM, prokaryote
VSERPKVVETASDVEGDEVLAALDVPPPRATLVLNGSAGALDSGVAEHLAAVFGADGLAGTVSRERLTTVTGGTDAGIFAILGRAIVDRSAPLIGVAPRALVSGPGGSGQVPLEPHHSQFVLVDGDEWGDETATLLALSRALGRTAPSVAVICGGGPVTRKEVLGHVRDGRPLIVLAGSGRLADELALGTTALVDGAKITVCPVDAGGHALARSVVDALWPR